LIIYTVRGTINTTVKMAQEDLRELILTNLSTMKQIVESLKDSTSVYKARAYDNAIKKLPNKPIRNQNDMPKIAGANIMEKIKWIIQFQKNLAEVEQYLKNQESAPQGSNKKKTVVQFEEREEAEDSDEEEAEDSDEEEYMVSYTAKEVSKRHKKKVVGTLKSLNSIESQVYELDLHNEYVTSILSNIDLLKRTYQDEIFDCEYLELKN